MLHEQIKNNIKEAMMAKDNVRLETYRNMLSSFTNELVSKGKKPNEMLGDEEAIAVITRLSKQRKDSMEQFKKGNREDLVAKEQAELSILETYLPKLMDKGEVEKIAKAKNDVSLCDLISFFEIKKDCRNKVGAGTNKGLLDNSTGLL
ncbi:MAG: hypothetical protein UY16_C0003G0001 [Candidatus Gottesmanbacteria bacterium GW2011_GWA2_47_9]|uniref:GatB/YqeY domain-containing protein n=1 Tax=Candidatus Gottesmanbacteria bacterium GW2011_GWA2_47_9 TaxID=1618445 RepID=A0A0G1U3N6_9BACT|nr:MAG: hypothetical protein UY16_C0003G0001 [Candidatus Gottesmanbacteria bacterium GW2011_GWA2_47_9]